MMPDLIWRNPATNLDPNRGVYGSDYPNFVSGFHISSVSDWISIFGLGSDQGGSRGRAIVPQKPTKVNLFTMILYNSENSICDIKPFSRPLFFLVTAVLWSIPHLSCSSEAVMRLDYQILLKSSPPNGTEWIRPWSGSCWISEIAAFATTC